MLDVVGVRKEFGTVIALRGVSLQFRPGEVHGLIGENGAGKSTLMKLLSGLEQPTVGEVRLDGNAVNLKGVQSAIDRGIVMIHQELNLVDDLSVAENVFLGREPRKGLAIDYAKMRTECAGLLEKVNAKFGPDTSVRGLSIADKQLVEIAKAISYDAKYLIMDEPTAVLTGPEVRSLFALIRDLKARNVSVVYISHLLPEILEISDRISVLRDGEFVGELDPKTSTPQILAESMVGRELGEVFPPLGARTSDEVVLEVTNLSTTPHHQPVSFQLRAGEILGMAGLIGAGRTEISEALAGFRKSTGQVKLAGEAIEKLSPSDRRKRGLVYVSEDRKGRGLHLTLAISENASLPTLADANRFRVNDTQVDSIANGWVEKLGIKTSNIHAPVKSLSGGNQQKVAIAKWLQCNPKVVIFDEPTRGVDVGAKREIYNLIVDLAKQGLAVILVSSELPEVIGLCHRVLVLRNGTCEAELAGEQLNEKTIMTSAAGLEKQA
jgi:ribose transport system ATP-binding protein